MNKKIVYFAVILLVGLSAFNFMYSSSLSKNSILNRGVSYNYALASGEREPGDDERNVTHNEPCFPEPCSCVFCNLGQEDCSPTCPCCE